MSYDFYDTIGGSQYGKDRILSQRISGGVFAGDTPGIGGCEARQIDLTVFPNGTIPTNAEIKIFAKRDGDSSWTPNGVFYVNTRRKNYTDGTTELHGYDAIAKLDRYLWRCLPQGWESDSFSWWSQDIMRYIAQYIGVELAEAHWIYGINIYDPRAEQEQIHGEGEQAWYGLKKSELVNLKMRTVAQHIAAASAGNWIITKDGKLKLCRFTLNYTDQHHADLSLQDYWYEEQPSTWVNVRYTYSGMPTVSANDNTAGPLRKVCTAECPFATQSMAQAALDVIYSTYYHAFTATGAHIPPWAELSSTVFIGPPGESVNVYHLFLANMDTQFDSECVSDISAPDEGRDEFPREDSDPLPDSDKTAVRQQIRDAQWVGTQEAFDALETTDKDIIYYIVEASQE